MKRREIEVVAKLVITPCGLLWYFIMPIQTLNNQLDCNLVYSFNTPYNYAEKDTVAAPISADK